MAVSKVPTDPNMTREVRTFLDDVSRQVDGITTATISAAGLTQTDFLSGGIKTPLAQDYRVVEKMPFAATLTGFTAKTSSGTLTATLKINTTAVTSGAINVTSTQGSVTPTAANVMAADDALVITLSSVSSAVDLSFTVKYTKTLES